MANDNRDMRGWGIRSNGGGGGCSPGGCGGGGGYGGGVEARSGGRSGQGCFAIQGIAGCCCDVVDCCNGHVGPWSLVMVEMGIMVEMAILGAIVSVQRETISTVQRMSFLRKVGAGCTLYSWKGTWAISFVIQSLCGS